MSRHSSSGVSLTVACKRWSDFALAANTDWGNRTVLLKKKLTVFEISATVTSNSQVSSILQSSVRGQAGRPDERAESDRVFQFNDGNVMVLFSRNISWMYRDIPDSNVNMAIVWTFFESCLQFSFSLRKFLSSKICLCIKQVQEFLVIKAKISFTDPSRTTLGLFLPLTTQCAAVRTCWSVIKVPPQSNLSSDSFRS